MTAPAINPAQSAMPGLNAAGGAPNAGQATGALAGFEALMAALFPQVEPVAPAAPTAGPAVMAVDPLLVAAADAEAGEGEDEAVDIATEAGVDAATTALMADSMIPAQPIVEASKPVAAEATATTAGPASDDPAAAFATALPADAGVAEDSPVPLEDAAASVDEGAEQASVAEKAELPKLTESPKSQQAPAWGQDKAPGAPAAPALAHANPHANLAAKAAAAPAEPAPETPEAAVAVAEDQARTAAPPAFGAKTEPTPNAQGTGRSAKSERGKGTTETAAANAPVADAAPVEAAQAPTAVKAKDAVASATQGQVEAVERKVDDAKPAADTPDFAAQSETRAGSSASAAPAEAPAHVVRGSPETVANMAAQIIKKLEARTTRFDLELDPHGLGKVDVRVEIGANGRITAAMTFDNPQAAQDVKARANELQRALEQAGFDMSGGALSFDVAQDRGQGQGRAWQQEQNETGSAFRGQAFRAALETAGDAAEAANQGALRLSRGVRTGLDVRI